MSSTNSVSSIGSAPDASLAGGNITNSPRLAEKSIELTACAQIALALRRKMVWFGLTQAQERAYGFDAATELGGTAFILQFKTSSTVIKRGSFAGQRKFQCQHQQMAELVKRFGTMPESCFYFLPSIGTFEELQNVSGDLLDNSFLLDVADLPNPVPPSNRTSDYHYLYLDDKTPAIDITSKPFSPKQVLRLRDFIEKTSSVKDKSHIETGHLKRLTNEYLKMEPKLADLFFKNAALVVVL
ncbi:MAG TPA: hypothetical protein VFE22_03290 [Edaphobacter sp.]|nr:hypothetical protein [Edaphobacter sp.]